MKVLVLVALVSLLNVFGCLKVDAKLAETPSSNNQAKQNQNVSKQHIRFVGEGFSKEEKNAMAKQILEQVQKGNYTEASKTFQVLAKDHSEHQSPRSLDKALDLVNDLLVDNKSPYYFTPVDQSEHDNHAVEAYSIKFWKSKDISFGSGKSFELHRFTVAYDEHHEWHQNAPGY